MAHPLLLCSTTLFARQFERQASVRPGQQEAQVCDECPASDIVLHVSRKRRCHTETMSSMGILNGSRNNFGRAVLRLGICDEEHWVDGRSRCSCRPVIVMF